MTVGQNTVSGELLHSFVNRLENIRRQKTDLADNEKVIFAELRSAGFSPKTVRAILKIRAQKPHDLQEAQSELEMYMHALGMDSEAPLFRAVGRMSVDLTVRDQVIDAFKLLVPPGGEVIVKIGGAPVRLWRDETNEVRAEDWEPPRAAVSESKPTRAEAAPAARPIPAVDDASAEALGADAWRHNQPITSNPFPFGHPQRPLFDRGYRHASGSDGMGPPVDDDEEHSGDRP